MKSSTKGMLFMIQASAAFAMMSVVIRSLAGSVPLAQQLFFRNLIMLGFTLVMMRRLGLRFHVAPAGRLPLALRCIFGFLGMISLFYANNHLNVADVLVLQKLNPFFVTLLAAIFLRERLSWRKLLPLMVAFGGAVIIINPTGNYQLIPALVAVLSALFSGLAYTLLRFLRDRVPGMTIIFYFSLFSFIMTLVPAMAVWQQPSLRQGLSLLLIGCFAAVGQYSITKAYQSTEASSVALYDYSGAIMSPLLGLLFLGEVVSGRSILGMVLIIGSGFLAYHSNRTTSS